MNYEVRILSLSKDIERRKHMKNVMLKLNIPYIFFDALTPDDVEDTIIDKMFKNVDYYNWNINQLAVMATFLSHIELLKISYLNTKNLLIIEDDIDLSNNSTIDYKNVNFKEFDVFNLGTLVSCYSYFVSWEGAGKILNLLDKKVITQAYDWELYKLMDEITIKYIENPEWEQVDLFKSNIAPNGYELK
jgi:hypothetical protein